MTSATTTEIPSFDPLTETAAWRGVLRKAGLVYLFSRMCVTVGAAIVAAELRADANLVRDNFPNAPFADPHYANSPVPTSAVRPILDVLTSWDGLWYLRIVRSGYPRVVQPLVTYDVADARAAFFPAYPMLVRLVDRVLPGGDTMAALFTNFVLGAVAVLLVGLLARELFGVRIAERSMVLMALFPGSFVLSFAYTEALLLALAAGCMWCLLKRQWVLAGILAAIGTATRPNGIALIAACAIAALQTLDIHIDDDAFARGVADARIGGRLQRFDQDGVEIVVDVGHNPQAARALAGWLENQPRRATLAVYAALADKDVAGVVAALAGQVDAWHVAGLVDAGPRGETVQAFSQRLQGTAAAAATQYSDVQMALQAAIQQALPDGRVLVFGSFHTAAAALRALNAMP